MDIDKLEKLPAFLNSLKSRVNKLEVDKLVPALVKDLSKIKYLILISYLQLLLLMKLKKIPNITNLATITDLTARENKIPDNSKCITTPEFNRLTAEQFTARLKQTHLETKEDIADFVKKTDLDDQLHLDKKVTSNISKHLLIENESKKLQDKVKKLQTFDSSLFNSQIYFFIYNLIIT